MKVYKGIIHGDGAHVVTVSSEAGTKVLPFRLDLANHSPTGFAWGYGGSGPAQLALAICADALGNAVKALAVYQDFKDRVVAQLHTDGKPEQRWELTEVVVLMHVMVIERGLPWDHPTGGARIASSTWAEKFTQEDVERARACLRETGGGE